MNEEQDSNETLPSSESVLKKITEYSLSKNIADDMEDDELQEIATKVKTEADLDKDSMSDWMDRNQKALTLAMQVVEHKTFPWENASNVILPLITDGAYTFVSREYPQIIRGQDVVEAVVFGKDADSSKYKKSRRISRYMSWQLLVESEEWESETDKLLLMCSVIGTVFRKGYYDPSTDMCRFELCNPENIYINNSVKSLEAARRVTHRVFMHMNTIVENMRNGIFKEYTENELSQSVEDEAGNLTDPDRLHEILEQHRFLDLDNDGYQEPYIVTYHVGSKKILRISARYSPEDIKLTSDQKRIQYIKPKQYFIDYHFLPSPDGGFFSFGLGTILLPINETINTIINQLIDSGTLLNAQPLFIAGTARVDSKTLELAPGRINRIDSLGSALLKDSIMPLPLLPPSNVSMQLLELLIGVAKEIAGITEILTGQEPTQNSPATTVLALIKQGLVKYNAIHKRILRGFKKEFTLLFRLNHDYLNVEKYLNMVNDSEASADDFKILDLDVRPISDPNMSSETMRIGQAQAVYSLQEVDRHAAADYLLDAMDIEDGIKAKLLPPVDPKAPPPPEVQKTLAEVRLINTQADDLKVQHLGNAAALEQKQKELPLKQHELAIKDKETESKVKVNHALAVKHLAEAHKTTVEKTRLEKTPIEKPKHE